MTGIKHDQGKLRMDLIPPEAIEALAQVLTFGATKYGDRNWEQGISLDRLYAAVIRHLTSWRKGEQLDPESKIHHVKHALTNLAMAIAFLERDTESVPDAILLDENYKPGGTCSDDLDLRSISKYERWR